MSCDAGEVTEKFENEQPFRHFIYVTAHSPNLPRHFTYVTTHLTLLSLHLRHSSFSNPSVALPTSQFLLQPFFRFSYVTSSSLNWPGEPPKAKEIYRIIQKVAHKLKKIIEGKKYNNCTIETHGFRRNRERVQGCEYIYSFHLQCSHCQFIVLNKTKNSFGDLGSLFKKCYIWTTLHDPEVCAQPF